MFTNTLSTLDDISYAAVLWSFVCEGRAGTAAFRLRDLAYAGINPIKYILKAHTI